jgi:hypothetical protein
MNVGALSPRANRPGREADKSSSASAGVKNAWIYTSTPPYIFMVWCLIKNDGNFIFTFTLK